MHRVFRVTVAILVLAGLLLSAGCSKANPADEETKAIAKQFVEAVFVKQDVQTAMSITGPIHTYGYITEELVASTINDDTTKKCVTQPDSLEVGVPGKDVAVPAISEADKAKGVTERTAWVVGSVFNCKSGANANRTSFVVLDKIEGKWVVSKCLFYIGVNYWD